MSSDRHPIYTEKTRCRDCYKCVRNCPVKAIKVEDNSARIVPELCIYCGRCVYVCPAKAKKVRCDVDPVKRLIASGRRVILSLAPSWTTGVFGSGDEMLGKFHALGFSGVSETALGAEMVSKNTTEELLSAAGLTVSSACPSVVELFRRHYPHLLGTLSRQPSPLEAHALYLKKIYGEDTAVVFVGPCISKKLEADREGSPVEYALTFDEVLEWIDRDAIDVSAGTLEFLPGRATTGSLYALEGGMIASMEGSAAEKRRTMVPLSGVTYIRDALDALDKREEMLLELLSCPGGCVNGSGFSARGNQFSFRKRSIDHFEKVALPEEEHRVPDFSLPLREYDVELSVLEKCFAEREIEKALGELGKENSEDRLDCSGCGYNSCREFAIACLNGMGEKQMCVTNMRKRAQKKIDMLLRTLPMGVVIVNREYRIIDCNREFAALFAEPDYECDEEYVKSHGDLPLTNFIDLSDGLESIFDREKSLFHERMKFRGKFLKISFFSIERGNLAGIILQDITTTSVKREDVIRKAEEVINKNLQNVQQIASLLGENAAETEIILRSLTDQFQFAAVGAEE